MAGTAAVVVFGARSAVEGMMAVERSFRPALGCAICVAPASQREACRQEAHHEAGVKNKTQLGNRMGQAQRGRYNIPTIVPGTYYTFFSSTYTVFNATAVCLCLLMIAAATVGTVCLPPLVVTSVDF